MKKIIPVISLCSLFGLVAAPEIPDPIPLIIYQTSRCIERLAFRKLWSDQNAAGSHGDCRLGTDTQGKEFLQFNQAFNTAN